MRKGLGLGPSYNILGRVAGVLGTLSQLQQVAMSMLDDSRSLNRMHREIKLREFLKYLFM
jgi:hypothetical protein